MDGRTRLGLTVLFGVLAFALGWLKGYVSGARHALNRVDSLRRLAECRTAEDGCEWVYPKGHPDAGEPFGGHPFGGLHPAEHYVRHYRPFQGLALLETIEFDAARRLPGGMQPSGTMSWWEEPVDEEHREWVRLEDEKVRYRRWILQRLRYGRWAGLRTGVRFRIGPRNDGGRSLHLEIEVCNDSPVTLGLAEMRLTYLYRNPAVEWLRGRYAPRMPLQEFGNNTVRDVLPGESLRWSAEVKKPREKLAEYGMQIWPVFTLPRPGGVLYKTLPKTGRDGQIAVERLRGLAFWWLAVELVDRRGRTRKVKMDLLTS